MKRLIVSVTSDLSSDQRVHQVCTTLQTMGFDVLLIGCQSKNSQLLQRTYKTKRMHLWFTKGFLFDAHYNLSLFFRLLFYKKQGLLANDLDTLLPNFLISKIFGIPLVYDSHELFTEVPELTSIPHHGIPVSGKDLKNARDCLLIYLPVSQIQKPSIGCNIKWKSIS